MVNIQVSAPLQNVGNSNQLTNIRDGLYIQRTFNRAAHKLIQCLSQ